MNNSYIIHKTDTHLELNQMNQETFQHGSKGFPFQYYLNDYDGKKQSSVEWHWHQEMEFIMADRGGLLCKVGNKSIPLHKDGCILVNSSVIHGYEALHLDPEPSFLFRSIVFSADFIAPQNSAIYQKVIDPLIMSGIPYFDLSQADDWQIDVRDKLTRIYDVCLQEKDDAELELHILMSQIWKEIWNHRPVQEPVEEINKNLLMQSRMRLMMQFIWDNFSQPIKLEEIAASANLSVSMAQRCFHSCINDSPIHYLQNYRLNYARQLLKNGEDSILDIALKAGFGTAGYFDRVFKREMGITPRQFARQK